MSDDEDLDWGDWRKLYERPSAAFERLPLLTRGVASECTRRSDRRGRIVRAVSIVPAVRDIVDIWRVHQHEVHELEQHLQALLDDGYLIFQNGWLTIRNHEKAQRKDEAKRKAKRRAAAASTDMQSPGQSGTSGTSGQNGQPGPSGLVLSGLLEDQDQPNRSPRARDDAPSRTSGLIPCPADLRLTDAQRGGLVTGMMIPEWAVDAMQAAWVARWAGSSDKPRTYEAWQRSLDTTLRAQWQDPAQRPRRPGPAGSPTTTIQAGPEWDGWQPA